MSRRRSRVVNESTVTPLTKEAADMKQVLNDNIKPIPIEHVFRTNVNCRHERNTNRYHFNYPGEWRTITNQQLLIGIRAVYFKTAAIRLFGFTLNVWLQGLTEPSRFRFSTTFEMCSPTIPSDLADDINQFYDEYVGYNYPLCKFEATSTHNTFKFVFSNPAGIRYEIDEMTSDFKSAFDIPGETIMLTSGTTLIYQYVWAKHYNDLEITASFVNQTESQHLGYTGITFNPLKYYKINSSDTEFYIDLWTVDGLTPVMIYNDERDSVVIEAVLTTRPLR